MTRSDAIWLTGMICLATTHPSVGVFAGIFLILFSIIDN